jgi:hypothetical protein
MSKLEWIDDSNLYHEVGHLIEIAKNAKNRAEKKFGGNVIDPFSALFEISGFEIDFKTWFDSETTRQAQKSLQNHIGNFHQNILGHVDGWENLKTGSVIDLISNENKMLAEVKNKYNTISGGKLSDLYYSLDRLVSPKSSIYKGYTAYYVAIIPKSPARFDKPFTPSDRNKGSKCPSNECIREIDGASFYGLVTGYESALEDLFDILPEVIHECSKGEYNVNNKEQLKQFFSAAFG